MQITVSERAEEAHWARAERIAAAEGWTLLPRRQVNWGEPVFLVTRAGLGIRRDGRIWRWHDGMLHALRAAGERHPVVRLSELVEGDSVLDATLGLGTDARFLAEYTGRRVVGLEVSPAIARLTAEGLDRVGANVEVIRTDSREWMADCEPNSFDVVVADPMFPPRPHDAAPGTTLDAIRGVAGMAGLDASWLDLACRVARRAVVVRDMAGTGLLEALGAEEIRQRRGRLARYGVWHARCRDLTPTVQD